MSEEKPSSNQDSVQRDENGRLLPGSKINPTGNGGFGDNPQNRSDGRWGKDNSFSYWMNYFKSLTVDELKAWDEKVPDSEKSVAAALAYARVIKAQLDTKEFIIVAERTEGRPQQSVDLTTKGESITAHEDIRTIAEAIKDANRNRPPDQAPSPTGLELPQDSSQEPS